MVGIQIENRLRPCYISIESKKEKALFHSWTCDGVGFIPHITGIVELENGRVIEVIPSNITFCTGMFNDYCWDEKGVRS